MNTVNELIGTAFALATALVGYAIHHSTFWSICDFVFAPLAWIKWLILHQVSLTIIHSAFQFLLK